jgi:DUF1680 family protein
LLRSTESSSVVNTTDSPHTRLRPLPLSDVKLSDGFWEPRRKINREVTLPSQFEHIEKTGRLDNFRRAAGKMDGSFQGIYFNDSDVYKWLEGAAWSLATDPDPELEKLVDAAITEIESAQEPDGYLDTYYTFEKAKERWTNLKDMHELYCAGHLIQSSIAHHRATGKDSLLNVARRLADHICDTFGPEEEGKLPLTDGHEEIEMALVELYRDTGEERYLKQARFFLDIRGHGKIGGSPYHQDHVPFREMEEIVGHAVRAVYLNAGATDLYAETGDSAVLEALHRLWRSMTERRMYVSGGIGPRYEGEAFGDDYELPNARAYTETCAAIGSAMWAWRMLSIEGDARYADIMELALYNGFLSGVSLDGQEYFYQNPLADEGNHRRQEWFGCACCPPNVARMLSSLPGYFYSVSGDAIWTHLYAENEATVHLDGERTVRLRQHTRYPWDGEVEIEVEGEGDFALMLRIPAWCERGAAVEVNGEPFDVATSPGSYAGVRRSWRPGDTVRLTLPMPVRRVESHPRVTENVGRVALVRGPLLYCVEAVDTPDLHPDDVVLAGEHSFSEEHHPDLLGGVTTLRFGVEVVEHTSGWDGSLYRTAGPGDTGQRSPAEITAVPYYAWANREPGPMRVWLRRP